MEEAKGFFLSVGHVDPDSEPDLPHLPHSEFSIPFAGFDSLPNRSRSRCFSLLYAPFGSFRCF